MPNVTARVRIKEKHYEICVDLDEALKIKDGKGDITSALQSNSVFYDIDKGNHVSESDLKSAFGTSDLYEVAKKIIQKGEVQKTQEFREAKQEIKQKQILTILLKNTSDQYGKPYTEERLKKAMEEARIHIDLRTPEQQIHDIVLKLSSIIPIKIETKKIRIIIPAQFVGQAYAIIKDFKESEDWLSNGNLQAILNIPNGMQMDFYEKLNNITHGAVQSEELKKE